MIKYDDFEVDTSEDVTKANEHDVDAIGDAVIEALPHTSSGDIDYGKVTDILAEQIDNVTSGDYRLSSSSRALATQVMVNIATKFVAKAQPTKVSSSMSSMLVYNFKN